MGSLVPARGIVPISYPPRVGRRNLSALAVRLAPVGMGRRAGHPSAFRCNRDIAFTDTLSGCRPVDVPPITG